VKLHCALILTMVTISQTELAGSVTMPTVQESARSFLTLGSRLQALHAEVKQIRAAMQAMLKEYDTTTRECEPSDRCVPARCAPDSTICPVPSCSASVPLPPGLPVPALHSKKKSAAPVKKELKRKKVDNPTVISPVKRKNRKRCSSGKMPAPPPRARAGKRVV